MVALLKTEQYARYNKNSIFEWLVPETLTSGYGSILLKNSFFRVLEKILASWASFPSKDMPGIAHCLIADCRPSDSSLKRKLIWFFKAMGFGQDFSISNN